MEAAISESVKKLGYGALKREQYQIVKGFVCGNDVFGVLPTGIWKISLLRMFTLGV